MLNSLSPGAQRVFVYQKLFVPDFVFRQNSVVINTCLSQLQQLQLVSQRVWWLGVAMVKLVSQPRVLSGVVHRRSRLSDVTSIMVHHHLTTIWC